MNIRSSVLETIGGTPLVRLNRVTAMVPATVCAKLEQFNPMTSIKDRPALAMIDRAEREGRLRPGSTIAEATSGNTGLALAMVGAVRGYRVVLFVEEVDFFVPTLVAAAQALGAELVRTPDFTKAVAMANQFAKDDPDVFVPNQFGNPANPDCHERTAQEILTDAGPRLRAFVASFGSGGTISGVGRAIKRLRPDVKVVLVEPDTVRLFSGGSVSCSGIHGVGPTFKPSIMDERVVDAIVQVPALRAQAFMRRLAREEGILCGPSSGALALAAIDVAREYAAGDVVVTIFPDMGMRYLSLGLFTEPPNLLAEARS